MLTDLYWEELGQAKFRKLPTKVDIHYLLHWLSHPTEEGRLQGTLCLLHAASCGSCTRGRLSSWSCAHAAPGHSDTCTKTHTVQCSIRICHRGHELLLVLLEHFLVKAATVRADALCKPTAIWHVP